MLMKMRKREGQKGFTLIELMIVIAIIGILAAIAIPQFTKYRARGYMAACRSDAKNAYTAVITYMSDTPGVLNPGEVITPGTPGGTYDAVRATGDAVTGDGVTITITGGAAGVNPGNVSTVHTLLGVGGSYTINGVTGAVTDTLIP